MASRRQNLALVTAVDDEVSASWGLTTLAGSFLVAKLAVRNDGGTPAWDSLPSGWVLAEDADEDVASAAKAVDRAHVEIYVIENAAARSGAELFGHDGAAMPVSLKLEEWAPGAGEVLTLDQVAALATDAGGTTARDTGTTDGTAGATLQTGMVAIRNGARTLASIKNGFIEDDNAAAGAADFSGMRIATGTNIEAAAEPAGAATGWTVNNAGGSQGTGAIVTILVTVGGGTTVPIEAAVETDTAATLDAAKTKAIAAATETDLAAELGREKTTAIQATLETDSAQALAHTLSRQLAVAAETDSAAALARAKLAPLAAASETDVAAVLDAAKTRTLAAAVETDLAATLGVLVEGEQIIPITAALELDSAAALGRAKTHELIAATEADVAAVLAFAKERAFQPAVEFDTAATLGRLKKVVLAAAVETDVAGDVAARRVVFLVPAVEDDLAAALGWSKTRTIAVAIEIDTAGILTLPPTVAPAKPRARAAIVVVHADGTVAVVRAAAGLEIVRADGPIRSV